jgi:hypothetical protein
MLLKDLIKQLNRKNQPPGGWKKCPSVPLLCHPHGWPKGNPKYNKRNKEQGSSLKYTINGKKAHA